MPLPTMTHDKQTLTALHQAAHLLAAVRLLALEHDPNWLELALKPVPEGLSTDLLPSLGEVILDYGRGALVVQSAGGEQAVIALVGQSQRTLFQRLLASLAIASVSDALPEQMIPAFYAALAANGRRQSIKPEAVSDETPLQVDMAWAATFAGAVDEIFTGIARFRARLGGAMTPLVVWPEHFDLSMLWFAAPAADEHSTPHLNFGFSPPSPGIDDFYLYAYAYPYPDTFEVPALPPGARWQEQPWRGVVVPYPALTDVEATCEGIFRALRPLLG